MSGAPRARSRAVRVVVVGRGKLGRAWARELRRAAVAVEVRAGRSARLGGIAAADLVLLAVADAALAPLAARLARAAGRWKRPPAFAHCAGRLGPEVLAPLQGAGASVAKAHPLVAVASAARSPVFTGAWLHLSGDARACALVARVARSLGMHVWRAAGVDHVLYHAAAALVANGAAALCALGAGLVAHAAGASGERERARVAPARMLGALLASVADNVGVLGLPAALTGPVRRGDTAAVRAHLAALALAFPEAARLLAALVRAQLPMARQLGEAPQTALAELGALVADATQFERAKRARMR